MAEDPLAACQEAMETIRASRRPHVVLAAPAVAQRLREAMGEDPAYELVKVLESEFVPEGSAYVYRQPDLLDLPLPPLSLWP